MGVRRKAESADSAQDHKKQKTASDPNPPADGNDHNSSASTYVDGESLPAEPILAQDISSADSPLTPVSSCSSAPDQSVEKTSEKDLIQLLRNGAVPDVASLNFEGLLIYINHILQSSFQGVRLLRTVLHYTGSASSNDDGTQPTTLAVLADTFPSDPELLVRLAKLCALPGSKKIKNLALIPDPKTLSAQKFIKFNSHAVRFFLVGTCAFSQLKGDGRNHQICVVPFASIWDRAASVMAEVYGKDCIFISSFKDGLSFSSGWKKTDENGKTAQSNAPTVCTLRRNKDSSRIPNIVPFDDIIPIYDAVGKPFDLASYERLPPFPGKEVPLGAAVMPIFTVSKFPITPARREALDLPKCFDLQITFNIQAVIVLAYKDYFPRETNTFNIVDHALGVLFTDPPANAVSQDDDGEMEAQEDEEDEGVFMV